MLEEQAEYLGWLPYGDADFKISTATSMNFKEDCEQKTLNILKLLENDKNEKFKFPSAYTSLLETIWDVLKT